MTPAAPRCPGGKRFPHARAAKRYAFENEPDKTRRPVHVQCDGHYHLAPRDAAHDPGGMSAAGPNTDQPGG